MKKYKVKSTWQPSNTWTSVCFSNGDVQFKRNFLNDFAQHLSYGDTVYMYTADLGCDLAYYANGHLYFTVNASLASVDLYTRQYLSNPFERGLLNIALMRTLRRNKIKPSILFKDNLRKYITEVQHKKRIR